MPEKFTVIVYTNLKQTVEAISKSLVGSPYAIAGITDSFINTRTLLSQYAPEILIIHLKSDGEVTNGAVLKLKAVSPRTKIVVVQDQCNGNTIFNAIRAGADVFIPEDLSLDGLTAILDTLLADEIYLPVFVAESLLERHRQELASPTEFPFTLTEKEEQILIGFTNGSCLSEVAEALALSDEMVRAYANNILQKIHFVDIAKKQYEEIMSGLSGFHSTFQAPIK
jgi:DNA-binding NarL/FixJ family response regulator